MVLVRMDNEISKGELIFNAKSKSPTSTPSERRSFMGRGSSDEILFNRKKKTLSPEKIKELTEVYQRVVVNDFGDEYHMSEEERKKKFRYYEVFSKVTKCKRKYRKLDEFVKVYRLCIDCLKVVAEENGVYNPEKFMKMVIKGEIEVFGLHFPKYVGKDKKDINWNYISEFIMDYDKDPSELSKGQKLAISDMDDEDALEMLFTKEDLEKLMKSIDESNEDEIFMPFDEDEDDYRPGVAIVSEKKDMKELIKFAPDVIKRVRDDVKEQRRKSSMNSRLGSFVFEMTEDDFEYIQKMDQSRGYQSDSDIPEFKGDIMKRKDYMKYLHQLDVYENEQIKVNYNGKMKTQAEINEIELKDALEKAGWNVRNLYKEKDREKKLKKAAKRDRKREEELKKRLLEVQKRQDKRSKKGIEFDAKKKKKSKKKKKDKESD